MADRDAEIRELASLGLTRKVIARELGCSQSLVRWVLAGRPAGTSTPTPKRDRPVRPCVICGQDIPPSSFASRQVCSGACSNERKRRHNLAEYHRKRQAQGLKFGERPPRPRRAPPGPPQPQPSRLAQPCVICGVDVPTRRSTSLTCSPPCAQRRREEAKTQPAKPRPRPLPEPPPVMPPETRSPAIKGTWWKAAACKGMGLAVFYPEDGEPFTAEAREVCARCPVTLECLHDAIGRKDDCGYRGGMTPRQRRAYARRVATVRTMTSPWS